MKKNLHQVVQRQNLTVEMFAFQGLSRSLGLNATRSSSICQGMNAVRFYSPAVRPKYTQISRLRLSRQEKKNRKIAKVNKNKARQLLIQEEFSKVDPVLGLPDTPFIDRIKAEVLESVYLAKGYSKEDVEKLLFGAQHSLLSRFDSDSETWLKKNVIEDSESRREAIFRILSMKNTSKRDECKLAVSLARKEFQREEGDTGSSEVQAAVMTIRIQYLMDHVKLNQNDLHKIRQLRMLVQQRQKILKYLKTDNPKRYFWAIHKLGLTDAVIHTEFNMDKEYMEKFQVWPGRVLVKRTTKDLDLRRKERRKQKRAIRELALSKENATA